MSNPEGASRDCGLIDLTAFSTTGNVRGVIMESNCAPKHGTGRKLIVAFLPKTLVVQLTVLGFIFGVITAIVPAKFDGLPGIVAAVMFGWAFVAALVTSLKEKGHRQERLRRTLTVTAGIVVIFLAIRELSKFLAFMAAGGNAKIDFGFSSASGGGVNGAAIGLTLFSIVILIWIPDACFRIQLDVSGTGDAQRVLLGLITAVSCVLTSVAFLLLHFDGGPLRNVSIGTLVVGVIGVVLLVAPPYRSLAKACWQGGTAGVFSLRARIRHWRNMEMELEQALGKIAERDATPPDAPPPDGSATASPT